MTTSRNAEKHNVKVKSSASEKLKKIDEIMNTTGKGPAGGFVVVDVSRSGHGEKRGTEENRSDD